MNTITEINADMLDRVSGGATSFASTIAIAADGSVNGTYSIGDRSGSFSSQLSVPVYEPVTISLSNTSSSLSFNTAAAA